MHYTIEDIPPELDVALRKKAAHEGKSLNDVAIETLRAGLEQRGEPVKFRDLSDIAGTWVEDPEFDKAIEWQRRIDPEKWR